MDRATEESTARKEHLLESTLKELESALIAFSGGVDSSFLLLKALQALGRDRVLAVTAASPLYPPEEVSAACDLAARLGARHVVIETEELSQESFCVNPPDRCYHCKAELFDRLAAMAREHGLKHLLDGSNLNDADDYRPGTRAARELGVRSPLQEAGLSKDEIRLLSRRQELSTWDKPAAACLASRFPYGERLELDKLRQVEQGERFLRSLGLKKEVRLRRHGSVARIEVVLSELDPVLRNRQAIVDRFKELGFHYVALDLEGFQSGSMNRVLE